MNTVLWMRLSFITLMIVSNIFMAFAWRGHLKHKGSALIGAILPRWLIPLPEYSLKAPSHRIGPGIYSTGQLKTILRAITRVVFSRFTIFYLQEPLRWSALVGFWVIFAGSVFVFVRK